MNSLSPHEMFSFLRLPFFLDFTLLPHFLKAIYAKSSRTGVLLGE